MQKILYIYIKSKKKMLNVMLIRMEYQIIKIYYNFLNFLRVDFNNASYFTVCVKLFYIKVWWFSTGTINC